MDKFVLRKIKTLKQIKPDSSWLESQKSFLLSEISREQNEKREPSLVLPLLNFNILKIFKPSFAIALGIIVLITSFGTIGAISATQNSLPGDFFYPVKTAFEQTQLTFTSGEENKSRVSIKMADHRIDEFTQLIDKPDKKKDIEKTVQKFTEQMIAVQENMDKLKEKNTEKATEVAKLIKAQALIYEETLIEAGEQLAYIVPEDREDIKEGINQALEELNKAKEQSNKLINESETAPLLAPVNASASENSEEILVPAEEIEKIVTPSIDFENIQPETK